MHDTEAPPTADGGSPAPSRRPWHPSRRSLFIGSAGGLLAAVVGGVRLYRERGSGDRVAPIQSVTPPRDWRGSFLQVVAHPDDDLYFLNPWVQAAILSGGEVATVVMTSAEGDGRNVDTDDKQRGKAPVDYPGYSGARQNGLRRAYALMAGADVATPWRREAETLSGGLVVEHATSAAFPHVHLYFFNLRKGDTDPVTAKGRPPSLDRLFNGTVPFQATMPVTSGPLKQRQEARRAQVLAGLVAVMERHRPSVVRALDPDPEHQKGKEQANSDHVDHGAAARFAIEAVGERARKEPTAGRPVVEHYRAYANRFWPRNLAQDAHSAKARLLAVYAGADGSPCPGHDCGDYQLGDNPYRSTHIYSTADRYPAAGSWLVAGKDGRLTAVAVLGGRVAVWREEDPGKNRWSGPDLLAGEWIPPTVSVVTGPDDRTHIVALRRTTGKGGEVTVNVVRTMRTGPDARFGDWEALGNPDAADRRRQREVGVPTAALDADNRLHVFVRDFAQGLSTRAEGAGGWAPWRRLGGSGLQDMPCAVTTREGCVEVYVPDGKTVVRWHQAEPRGPFVEDRGLKTRPVASGGFTVVRSEDDRAVLYFRQADTAKVMAYRQAKDRRSWPHAPESLDGDGGTGPVAAVWRAGRRASEALLASRNAGGGVSATGRARDGGGTAWRAVGGMITRAPALALDASGRAVLVVVGVDGRLHVARQDGTGPDGGFGAWTTV